MTKIYIVRHGQASAGWEGDVDPGLSRLGKEQAEAAAKSLAPLGPIQVLTSPLARAGETAQTLCSLWQIEPEVEARVAEIPSPTKDLAQRSKWLHKVMQDRWSNLDSSLQIWRRKMIDAVREITEDTVIFSHFIAINVLVGEAIDNDTVVGFLPDNASITTLEVHYKNITLLEKGKEAKTIIR
jgi:broad specificity phosphatase PhoE